MKKMIIIFLVLIFIMNLSGCSQYCVKCGYTRTTFGNVCDVCKQRSRCKFCGSTNDLQSGYSSSICRKCKAAYDSVVNQVEDQMKEHYKNKMENK